MVIDLDIDREEFITPADGDIKGDLKLQTEDFLESIEGVSAYLVVIR